MNPVNIPERFRHCERTGPVQSESRPLGISPEKAGKRLPKRESGDLLGRCRSVFDQKTAAKTA